LASNASAFDNASAVYTEDGPGPLYTLIGNATAEIVDGVASFSGLMIQFRRFFLGVNGPRGGIFRFKASANGLHNATSANFSVLLPSVPYAVKFGHTPPSDVIVGRTFDPPLNVSIVGVSGEPVALRTPVALEALLLLPAHSATSAAEGLPHGHGAATPPPFGEPPAAVLTGVTNLFTDEGGFATFGQLSFRAAGSFMLRASAPELHAAYSGRIAAVPPPAQLPCPEAFCQWAASASAGRGALPPVVAVAGLSAEGHAMSEVGDEARYLGHADRALVRRPSVGGGDDGADSPIRLLDGDGGRAIDPPPDSRTRTVLSTRQLRHEWARQLCCRRRAPREPLPHAGDVRTDARQFAKPHNRDGKPPDV
jgi:hypothetical protein